MKRTDRTKKPSLRAALLATLVGICAALASAGSWGALNARLDRRTAQDGDVVTLNIEREGSPSQDQPDLSPLRKDFDVLGTSTSTQTSFVNGTRSDRSRWQVRLQPRHPGRIDVPPIAVGSEKTQALQLEVAQTLPQAAAQTGKLAIVESEIGSGAKSIYVQQQIPYTVRLYYDDAIQEGELAAPHMDDAIVEQLGDEKRYSTMRDGHQYRVIERHYAVAPEKSGTLRIPAATFRGRAATALSERDSNDDGVDDTGELMSRLLKGTPFANDPAFRSLLAGARLQTEGRPVAASGPEITLEVLPRPAAVTGDWLPAEQVTLHDSWTDNPPKFKVGEPVTRTITIDAKGLGGSQIPPINVSQPEHANLYAETADNQSRADGDAIYGTSKQTLTYIPTAAGTFKVPAIELAWWNTSTEKMSRATLQRREFEVLAGAAGSSPVRSPPAARGAASSLAGSAAAPAAATPATQPLLSRLSDAAAMHWIALLSGAVILIAAVLLLVWVRHSRAPRRRVEVNRAPAATLRKGPTLKDALRTLRAACAADDPRAAQRALLEIGRAGWPTNAPAGMRELANRVGAGAEAIDSLEKSLYAAHASPWKGAALWDAFRHGLKQAAHPARPNDDALAPLYR
ncbi:MAG: BatD family protein [Casimicrobiaceae bacterium]